MKATVIKFIDELLSSFENNNKIVYRRLVHIHHKFNNTISEELMILKAKEFLEIHPITCRNYKFLKGTDFETDAELLWEVCTPENKIIIWKWIDVIIEKLNYS